MVSDFYHMSIGEQVQRFKDYRLEEQYELFLFGTLVVHPPAIHLIRPFAEQGPIILPFLKTKLETVQNEWTIYNIIRVFSELARLKIYDVSKDSELKRLIDRKVNNMRGIWKKSALKTISEMWSMEL